MGKKLNLLILIGVIILLFISDSLINRKNMHLYLQDIKLNVVSFEGKSQSYKLTKDMLLLMPYKYIWGYQESYENINVKDYLGKEIIVYQFVVDNHSVQNLHNAK